MPFKIDEKAMDELVDKIVVNTQFVSRMERVAEASNSEAGIENGYRVGVQGDPSKELRKHDQRMTVITATAEAMIDCARNDTLIKNFYLAGGD